jgi:predicted AAA+ superfamily ATPase
MGLAERGYLKRLADGELSERLERIGAVLIEGAKGCGKTETARRRAASEVRLDIDQAARATAEEDPAVVLNGPAPRLVDEWQYAPGVWNAVRRAVDDRQADGQFILTGSAHPNDDATRHSGAGRISRLRMRTLSLSESGHSTSEVSLAALLRGEASVAGQAPGTLADVIGYTCHGGWPGDHRRSTAAALANLRDYAAELAYGDIRTVDGVRRDPIRVTALLRSLARNTATEASLTTLAADASQSGARMSDDTVGAYFGALRRLMVYEPLEAWSPVIRSKARLRTGAKHHFVDPALAVALLGTSPEELALDVKTFAFLFESLCLRDVRVYTGPLGATVGHYRDSTGLEVDILVSVGHRRWAALEVKLGGSDGAVDKAAASLLAFAGKVDTQSSGPPAALVVLTASGYAHTRRDGVHVVPLTCLGP